MSYSSTVLSDNPIRYYRLGESSGTTAVDIGSQAQNGTITGGVTLSQVGLISDSDTAMLFDGSTGYISLPTTGLPTGAQSWSMEVWASTTSFATNYQPVMAFGTGAGQESAGLYSKAVPEWLLASWVTDIISDTSPAPTTRTTFHLAATYDGTTANLYVNGVQYLPTAQAWNIIAGFARIGSDTGVPTFSGVIDEVAIYDYALTSAQILNHYTVGTTPTSSVPVPTDYVPRSGFLASFDYNNNAQPINPGPYDPRGIGGTIYWRASERAVQGTFLEVPDDTGRYVQRGGIFSTLIWSAQQFKDIATRFNLALLKDIVTRFILVGRVLNDIPTRFRLLQQSVRDITSRFRLKSADQLKDVSTRFRLAQQSVRDITSRFRLMQQSLRDISTRFRLAKLNDIATRFRLAKLNDIKTRFRLKSADQLKDIATRFILAVANQQVKDIATRLRLMSANQLKDITTRFRLAKLKDISSRFRLMSANQLKDVASRFILVQQRLKDVSSRFRLKSADQAKDVASRLRLMSANQLKDVKTRLRLKSADQLRDIAGRFILTSVGTLRADDISSRFILIAPSDVVWVSRDGKTVWNSRDDLATWKAR